jgi:type IX secretion system substrate protein
MKKLLFTLIVFGFLIILDINLFSFSSGITGLTKKNGADIGCVCHSNHKPNPQVSVFFTGPDSAQPGQTIIYKIKLSHGPAVRGGFDVATYWGVLDTVSTDTTVRKDIADGELTHKAPKPFVNDTVSWTFKYTAPLTPRYDTLYAVANSTNFNGQSDTLDQWNFSANFPIRVGIPFGIINNNEVAKSFSLGQNYPNPFNASSKFKVQIPAEILRGQGLKSGRVKVTVFDILGNEVGILLNQQLKAGEYEVEFDGTDLPSGVYFYKLSIINSELSVDFTDTKKMILLK